MSNETAANAPDARAATVKEHASIISPVMDFLLVGGVSVFIIPFVMLPVWEVEENSRWLHFAAYCLIFVLNLPHFIHSYQLLYRGYIKKLTGDVYQKPTKIRMVISGMIAPAFLIAFLVYAAMQDSSRMLGYATNLMLFTLGWHYVKQGYGIMIALSVRKKVFFSTLEKHLLLANAYITWLYSWFVLNTYENSDAFHGIPYSTVGLPAEWREPSLILYTIWTIGAAAILLRKFDAHDRLCFNGLAAYFFSVYPWVLLAFAHPNIIIFVPALHSLQYILCVWKLVYERTKDELAQAGKRAQEITGKMVIRNMVPFLTIGFGAGALFFVMLPLWLDNVVPYDKDIFGPSLFVYCFLIFLNIHHYFIDFSIWRRDNPEMQYLFK